MGLIFLSDGVRGIEGGTGLVGNTNLMIFFCKEETLRDLIKQIFALLSWIIKSLWDLIVWTWNKILDTQLSTYWKIFWWALGVMLALGLVVMAYEKIKALQGKKVTSPKEAKQEPQRAELTEHTCRKCGLSVPVEEYAIHVQECMKRDRT